MRTSLHFRFHLRSNLPKGVTDQNAIFQIYVDKRLDLFEGVRQNLFQLATAYEVRVPPMSARVSLCLR